MQKNRTNRTRRFNHSNRKGTAPLELTLFLPTYAAMLMVLFTIFSFARTRGEVAVETRHEAWMKRSRSGKETALMEVAHGNVEHVGRILNQKQDPALGLVTATRQKNATIYLKTLKLFSEIQLNHAVMTDTWDYQTMPFEEQNRHPRLTFAERTLAFGSLDRGAFASLASATSAFSRHEQKLQQSLEQRAATLDISPQDLQQAGKLQHFLEQRRDQAMFRVNQARGRVSQAISATETKLKNLNAELKQQLSLVPPDQVAISDLKKKVADASKEIEKLKQQLSDLNISVTHLANSLGDSGQVGE